MNTLPVDSSTVLSSPVDPVGSMAKESLGGITPEHTPETSPLVDVATPEFVMPKEVTSAGVQVHPTTVTIPAPVAQMGVTAIGHNVSLGTGASVTLPLSDDQIAQGLSQDVKSSWRWLAEWCIRRLKSAHIAVKMIHGVLTRKNAV